MRRGWEVGPQRKGRTWRATHRRHGAKQGAPGAPKVIRSRKRQSKWHTDERWGREKRWRVTELVWAKLGPSQSPGWPLIPAPLGFSQKPFYTQDKREPGAHKGNRAASRLIPGSDRPKMRAMPRDHRTDRPGGVRHLLPAPPPPSPSCTHTSASSQPPSGQHLPCPDQKPWPLPPSQRLRLRGSYLAHTHNLLRSWGARRASL